MTTVLIAVRQEIWDANTWGILVASISLHEQIAITHCVRSVSVQLCQWIMVVNGQGWWLVHDGWAVFGTTRLVEGTLWRWTHLCCIAYDCFLTEITSAYESRNVWAMPVPKWTRPKLGSVLKTMGFWNSPMINALDGDCLCIPTCSHHCCCWLLLIVAYSAPSIHGYDLVTKRLLTSIYR